MGMNISEVGGDIFDYQYKIDEIKEITDYIICVDSNGATKTIY